MSSTLDVAHEPVANAGKVTLGLDLVKLGHMRHTRNTKRIWPRRPAYQVPINDEPASFRLLLLPTRAERTGPESRGSVDLSTGYQPDRLHTALEAEFKRNGAGSAGTRRRLSG